MSPREWRLIALVAEIAPIAGCPACRWGLINRASAHHNHPAPPCSVCAGVASRLAALKAEVMPIPPQVANLIEGRRPGIRAAGEMREREARIAHRAGVAP